MCFSCSFAQIKIPTARVSYGYLCSSETITSKGPNHFRLKYTRQRYPRIKDTHGNTHGYPRMPTDTNGNGHGDKKYPRKYPRAQTTHGCPRIHTENIEKVPTEIPTGTNNTRMPTENIEQVPTNTHGNVYMHASVNKCTYVHLYAIHLYKQVSNVWSDRPSVPCL